MKKSNKLAVFDIDGTIFRKNLHFELINELVWFKVFPNSIRDSLTRIYTDWLEHEGTYEMYRKALVDLYAKFIKGCSEEDVRRAAEVVVGFQGKRTYIFAEDLIARLRREEYHIIAVSGSPIEVVEAYNRSHLKFDAVFGSVYATDDGIYTGEASFEPSRNKGELVKQYLFEHNLTFDDSYGIGDTESDGSFLRLVEHPVAFNPNSNLKKLAEKEGWRIVVEKKDVVYEIQ